MHGHTYNNPVPGGYTANHAEFMNDKNIWQQKASTPRQAKPIGERIAVRVVIGIIHQGTKKVSPIGVSIN